MTRTTHRFLIAGDVAEVYVLVGTPDEWAADPASKDARWSTWDGGSVIIATRLALATGGPLAVHSAGGAGRSSLADD